MTIETKRCAVLFPGRDRDAISPTDFDGCVLPNGHFGPHEFVGSDLHRYTWATDLECKCEDCQSDEVDNWCIVWSSLPKQTLRRWSDIPRDEQKSCYWVAIPDDPDTILDGKEYEIVYVYFDGKWSVMRPGQSEREPLSLFRFLHPIEQVTL